jgi:hypothetical protein
LARLECHRRHRLDRCTVPGMTEINLRRFLVRGSTVLRRQQCPLAGAMVAAGALAAKRFVAGSY